MCGMDEFPGPYSPYTGTKDWGLALAPNAAVDLCSSFAGVSCNSTTGRVNSIILAGAELLTGTLPASLSQLTSLQLFGVCPYPATCSGISGTIPSSYASLTNLVSGMWASQFGTSSLPLCGSLPAGWCLSANRGWLGVCPPGFSDRFVDGNGVFSGLGDQRTWTLATDLFGYGTTRLPPCAGEYGLTPAPNFGNPAPGSAGCVSPSHRFRNNFSVDVGNSAPLWTPSLIGGAVSTTIANTAGLPSWAPAVALSLSNPVSTSFSNPQYLDLGRPVIGGSFTLAMLVLLDAPVVCDYSGCTAYIFFFFDGSLGNPVGPNAWPQGVGIGISNVISTVVTSSVDAGYANGFSDPRDFATGTWQHLVLVYDGLYTWRLYRNGVFHVGSMARTAMERRAPLSNLRVGNSISGGIGDPAFPGQIADFQYYDGIVFSASNVTDLYTGALKAGCSA